MAKTVSLKRAQQLLEFSIEDDFRVTGMCRFFGRLPKELAFNYDSRKVYFKSDDGEFFIRFFIHPTKHRIFTAETSNGDSIDLYYFDPTFEYAVHKAKTTGKVRYLKNGRTAGWGKHVIKAWDNISADFQKHGIEFSRESLEKILQATIKRGVY